VDLLLAVETVRARLVKAEDVAGLGAIATAIACPNEEVRQAVANICSPEGSLAGRRELGARSRAVLTLTPGVACEHIGLRSVACHMFAVCTTTPGNPFLQPLRELFHDPAAFRERFLPGMPEPETVDLTAAAMMTEFRKCSGCGMVYTVGECGQQHYTPNRPCPGCGTNIGGGSAAQKFTGQLLDTRPNTMFCLTDPAEEVPAVRNLDRRFVACLRSVSDLVLWLAAAHGRSKLLRDEG
jgi:hypothetical protein